MAGAGGFDLQPASTRAEASNGRLQRNRDIGAPGSSGWDKARRIDQAAPTGLFIGFGQVWRAKCREPTLRRYLLTNGHSPSEYRASTVRNLDAWYEAFGATPGQALYLAPEQRVRVW
ncbi:M13-type metalloendopeptidase [Cystobacter fuscus]